MADLSGSRRRSRLLCTRLVRTRHRELLLVLCARRFAPHLSWRVEGGYQLFDTSHVARGPLSAAQN
ncbi:MAG: hypothetical protein ACJ76L_02205 [Conexibacter sp.]